MNAFIERVRREPTLITALLLAGFNLFAVPQETSNSVIELVTIGLPLVLGFVLRSKVSPVDRPSPKQLWDAVKNTSLGLEARRRAVETLKSLNPLAGAAAEAFLNEFATRALTPEEGRAERDAEVERREQAAGE